MEYTDQVKDYLNRCNNNLKIVKDNEGFEFTQLFSNFISALIFIKENRNIEKNDIQKYGLKFDIKANTYPIDFSQDAKQFIRHLRNACCHYEVKIEGRDNEIYKVIFCDQNVKKQHCKFEMTVKEIERVYKWLLNYI